jgi:predicted nucleotidyltransferase component of viral defense system
MKFDAAQIARRAHDNGFPADNLEKVLRLRELLIELHKHPFLKDKLVLRGGTALNLFYLGLARLSVDIDLNYIAHVDREAALRDCPDIASKLPQVSAIRSATRSSACLSATETAALAEQQEPRRQVSSYAQNLVLLPSRFLHSFETDLPLKKRSPLRTMTREFCPMAFLAKPCA